MKKHHTHKLRFHTIFSVALVLVFLIVLFFVRDISLAIAMLFLAVYIAGNGIIHAKYNELKRDTIVEYVIVSGIVIVVLIGALL